MSAMETDIAKIFKEARVKFGFSQEEMAARLGINRVTLSMYETGAIPSPGSDKLMKLMEMLQQTKGEGTEPR